MHEYHRRPHQEECCVEERSGWGVQARGAISDGVGGGVAKAVDVGDVAARAAAAGCAAEVRGGAFVDGEMGERVWAKVENGARSGYEGKGAEV